MREMTPLPSRAAQVQAERPTAAFSFDLPARLIDMCPVSKRGDARVLVLHRESGRMEHRMFADLPAYLSTYSCYINESKILRRWIGMWRLPGHFEKVYFIEPLNECSWRVFARLPSCAPEYDFCTIDGIRAIVQPEGGYSHRWIMQFVQPVDVDARGRYCIPPDYSLRETLSPSLAAEAVYASVPGSFAAPTAGIHFTPETLRSLEVMALTLHTSPGTFYGVEEESPADHRMEAEWYRISDVPAPGRKIAAIGTTVAKALEAWARSGAAQGLSELFIYPPFEFKVISALLTNFHRPRETLLLMTCAFGGYEAVMEAHREAVREGYRFSFYGDLLLII